MRSFETQTSAGRLAARVSPGRRGAVLLIHGNSMSKEAFDHQFASPLASVYRLIAIDLPGHGASARAEAPADAYSLEGYADALLEALDACDAADAVVCGWSLGGHVALEMMRRSPQLRGALAISAPPVRPGPAAIGAFAPGEALALLGREALAPQDCDTLVAAMFRDAPPAWAHEALLRADGRARRLFLEKFLGADGADPADLFGDSERPLGFVTGALEPFVRPEAFDRLTGPAIWKGGVQVIPGAGHAPCVEAPAAFNAILLDFLRHVAARRRPAATVPAAASASTPAYRLRAR